VLANELKGGEQIIIGGRIGSLFSESNGAPRIVFLYNAKTDETRNLMLLPKEQQNAENNKPGTNLSLL
jgi:hypothetical protein